MMPVIENILSEGIDVSGIDKYLLCKIWKHYLILRQLFEKINVLYFFYSNISTLHFLIHSACLETLLENLTIYLYGFIFFFFLRDDGGFSSLMVSSHACLINVKSSRRNGSVILKLSINLMLLSQLYCEVYTMKTCMILRFSRIKHPQF